VLCWFSPREPDAVALGQLPVFIIDGEHDIAYGFPDIGSGFKCASHLASGELFHADARILLSVPELDPYGPRNDVEYWGPLEHRQGTRAAWPEGVDRPRIFAYLRRFGTLDSLLDSIATSVCPALIHVAGMPAEECERRSTAMMRFSPRLLDASETLRGCDLVITHGGSLVSLALVAGKPMLTLPLHLEQQLTALKIESLGAGLNAPRLAPDGMRYKLARLLNEPAFTETARAFAARQGDHRIVLRRLALLGLAGAAGRIGIERRTLASGAPAEHVAQLEEDHDRRDQEENRAEIKEFHIVRQSRSVLRLPR
jgi:hypothetical protein